jgi:hypothetical protein
LSGASYADYDRGVELSGPHAASPSELTDRIAAERMGRPFLVWRDRDGAQHIATLDEQGGRITVGRAAECDISFEWDDRVSRVHAELHPVGSDWTLVDGGLSRNGTYVNGKRIADRRRLADGDTFMTGQTFVLFRRPTPVIGHSTVFGESPPELVHLSKAQRAVLVALCRPFAGGADYARPATNNEICEELFLSLDAVKGHLRALFAKFDLDGVPQNEKRLRLAERALTSGALSLADLRKDAS